MSAFALRLAILPSILLLMLVVGINKKRRNPTSLLVWLAVAGAISIIPAVIVELFGAGVLYLLGLSPRSPVYTFVDCFFIVALIEELGKFIGMLIITWKNKNFDHSYDGVIYGVCASLGFATLENIMYVFQGGISVGIMRAFSAVPLHCSCGVVMGYFYAKARECANKGDKGGAVSDMILAYVCALGIHGLYDFVLSVENASVVVSVAVLILAVILMVLLMLYAAKNDRIISVQPIWTSPYYFRYMPSRVVGQNRMQYDQQMYGGQAYGGQPQYSQQQYGGQTYGSQPQYSQRQYGGQTYGSQPQYSQQQYGGQTYCGQSQYSQQQYGGQTYGGQPRYSQQQYGGQTYGGQPQYSQQQYGGQTYGGQSQYSQQPYGGQPQYSQSQYSQQRYGDNQTAYGQKDDNRQ